MPMLEVLVLCEARADFEIATHLVRRVVEERDSLPVPLEDALRWRGVVPGALFTEVKYFQKDCRSAGLKFRKYQGFTRGVPQKSAAAEARKVVLVADQLRKKEAEQVAILFVRDLDSAPDRLEGMEQARGEARAGGIEMILATPDPKRETWVLAGFVARSPEEERRLKRKRDVKKIVERLTGGDGDREKKCWEVTPLELLEDRGRANRLAEYLQEVEERLLPLLTR